VSTWLDGMHREAVTLAIPLWTWHDGDRVDISCGIDPGSTMDDRDFYVNISVERPAANLRADRYLGGVEAAEFFNDLMERPQEHRCPRRDCVQHDYEQNTCMLSWEATMGAIASVYPERFGRPS
jgi:hypothetical protein